MKYENLDLDLFDYRHDGGQDERFWVRVLGSPEGGQKKHEAEEISIPADLRTKVRQLMNGRLTGMEMISLGETLAGLLFPPGARDLLNRSRSALGEEQGLRVRLRLNDYALADIPWEYAYLPRPGTPADQRGRQGFLVLDRRISLVRFEVAGLPMVSLDPLGKRPYRLVALMADPGEGFDDLELEAEREHIEAALVEVPDLAPEFYPDATLDLLEDALRGNLHVFHFAGHGRFKGDLGAVLGTETGKGYIILLDENRKAYWFEAEQLALSLQGRGVRLAVLGACESGRPDQANPWTGVAPALTFAGIPAVVGMQFKVGDEHAVQFSRLFYRALAGGDSVDAAVTDGRLAIYRRSGEADPDFGAPVLYLRAEEGVLFPKAEEEPDGEKEEEKEDEDKPKPPPDGDGRKVPDTSGIDQRKLRKVLVELYGEPGLEILCADIQAALAKDGIDLPLNLDIVGGRGLESKALNLIQHLDRRGYLGYLVGAVRESRPGSI